MNILKTIISSLIISLFIGSGVLAITITPEELQTLLGKEQIEEETFGAPKQSTSHRGLIPTVDNKYYIGSTTPLKRWKGLNAVELLVASSTVQGQSTAEYFTATSTTATSTFPNISVTNLDTNFTENSIIYAGVDGILTEDTTFVYNGGNVGIGTNAPSKELEVNGDTMLGGILYVGADDGTPNQGKHYVDGNGFYNIENTWDNASGAIRLNLRTSGTPIEALTADGTDVTINEGNANYNFVVDGQTNDDVFIVKGSSEQVGINNGGVFIDSVKDVQIGKNTGAGNSYLNLSGRGMNVYTASNGVNGALMEFTRTMGNVGTPANITLANRTIYSFDMYARLDGSEGFVGNFKHVVLDGNTYSGTNATTEWQMTARSASDALGQIRSVMKASGDNIEFNAGNNDIDFKVNDDTGVLMFGDAGLGYVGIGSSSPNYKLTVEGGVGYIGHSGSTGLIVERTGFSGAALHAGTGTFNFLFDENYDFSFASQSRGQILVPSGSGKTARLHIEGDTGYVGIGTSTPIAKLDIWGTIARKITSIITDYTASDEYYIECDATTGTATTTLPTAVGIKGTEYILKKKDATANLCAYETTGAETIDGYDFIQLIFKDSSQCVYSNGTEWSRC